VTLLGLSKAAVVGFGATGVEVFRQRVPRRAEARGAPSAPPSGPLRWRSAPAVMTDGLRGNPAPAQRGRVCLGLDDPPGPQDPPGADLEAVGHHHGSTHGRAAMHNPRAAGRTPLGAPGTGRETPLFDSQRGSLRARADERSRHLQVLRSTDAGASAGFTGWGPRLPRGLGNVFLAKTTSAPVLHLASAAAALTRRTTRRTTHTNDRKKLPQTSRKVCRETLRTGGTGSPPPEKSAKLYSAGRGNSRVRTEARNLTKTVIGDSS
jgi:hypothetical protein